jgi:DNA (cytosine-5)-methyltransferase 1
MRVLDLFSGIGGFSLGLERTGGFQTVAFCEIEEFPRRVLASHWPGVPIYHDVRELSRAKLAADGLADIDVICGGFPCQDISFAGKRAGLEGARSGLWGEYQRLIGELRPRFVIVENVPGLLSLGMGTVCGDLAALGYDAVWDCVPAAAVGAPHRRDRVWIVAHAKHNGSPRTEVAGGICEGKDGWRMQQPKRLCAIPHAAHAVGNELRQQSGRGSGACGAGAAQPREHGAAQPLADADDAGLEVGLRLAGDEGAQRAAAVGRGWWRTEPDVGRVAHGVPARVDRLKGLGNAVVPQIPEIIGRAILAAEGLAP